MDSTFTPTVKVYDLAEDELVVVIADHNEKEPRGYSHRKRDGDWKQQRSPSDAEQKEIQRCVEKIREEIRTEVNRFPNL